MSWPDNELIRFGWEIAEATLATAASERTLVTHWFHTGEDDSVNADDHFGSDQRTLRFLGVVLPTLIDQLRATRAVVALPWDVEGATPSLTVVALAPGRAPAVDTRALSRLTAASAPPFWSLEPDPLSPPAQLAAIAEALTI